MMYFMLRLLTLRFPPLGSAFMPKPGRNLHNLEQVVPPRIRGRGRPQRSTGIARSIVLRIRGPPS